MRQYIAAKKTGKGYAKELTAMASTPMVDWYWTDRTTDEEDSG